MFAGVPDTRVHVALYTVCTHMCITHIHTPKHFYQKLHAYTCVLVWTHTNTQTSPCNLF